MPKTTKSSISDSLRVLLIKKIQSEWDEKWKYQHGPLFDFNNLKSQNAFLNDLLDDIEKEIKKRKSVEEASDILISRDNLRRILNQKAQSNWQLKTKSAISYYVGYDGFDSYVETLENQPVLKVSSGNYLLSNKYMISFLVLAILVISFTIIYFKYLRINDGYQYFEIQKFENPNDGTPTKVEVKLDLPKLLHPEVELNLENEQFQYINDPTKIQVSNPNGVVELQFQTPGQKLLSLIYKEKIINSVPILIESKGWYACARIKSKTLEKPMVTESIVNKWFGNQMSVNDGSRNYITTATMWNNYQNSPNSKIGYLSFPEIFLPPKSSNFSRVIFEKAKKFDIDMDSVTLEFKAKRMNRSAEDCMSFNLHLYDNLLQHFEIYSSGNCKVNANAAFFKLTKSLKLPINFANVTAPQLNRIFEDFQWHQVKLSFVNHQVLLIIDGRLEFDIANKVNFGKLSELFFIFEGNGCIDDVVISNSYTHKIIFKDNFGE